MHHIKSLPTVKLKTRKREREKERTLKLILHLPPTENSMQTLLLDWLALTAD